MAGTMPISSSTIYRGRPSSRIDLTDIFADDGNREGRVYKAFTKRGDRLGKRHEASNGGQFAHDPVEAGLALEADAGAVRERNRAILDSGVIGKTTEVAKDTGI